MRKNSLDTLRSDSADIFLSESIETSRSDDNQALQHCYAVLSSRLLSRYKLDPLKRAISERDRLIAETAIKRSRKMTA